MCLAIPARVTKVLDHATAVASVGSVEQEISVELVDDVQVGDYVIVHVGFALHKLDVEEAHKTLDLFARMGLVVEDNGPEKSNP